MIVRKGLEFNFSAPAQRLAYIGAYGRICDDNVVLWVRGSWYQQQGKGQRLALTGCF